MYLALYLSFLKEKPVEKGADLECRAGGLETRLILAVIYRYKNIVKLLIAKGSDLESKDRHGRTALRYVFNESHVYIVMLLLERVLISHLKDVVAGQ